MKIECRNNASSIDMDTVKEWKVVNIQERSNLHFLWGLLIFFVFWPGLIIYAFIGNRKLYYVDVTYEDGNTFQHRVYQIGMDKMKYYKKESNIVKMKRTKYY